MSLNMLREAGDDLDLCLVMSYDAGDESTTGFNVTVRRPAAVGGWWQREVWVGGRWWVGVGVWCG